MFTKCLAQFLLYATQQGYELTQGEGYIENPRKARNGRLVTDGVHMRDSLHYLRLALDLNLFVRTPAGDWEFVTDSGHPAWVDLGTFWESLDPLCRWGGRFNPPDGNHVSVTYKGKA